MMLARSSTRPMRSRFSLLPLAALLALVLAPCPAQASDAGIMNSIKNNFGWGQAFNWPDAPVCVEPWNGVTCTFGRVTGLTLQCGDTKLNQQLPPIIANLTELAIFEVQDCNVFGPVPERFRERTKLTRIRLNGNRLEGRLDESPLAVLVQNPGFTLLDVSDNRFTGSPPTTIPNDAAIRVDLSNNRLTSIPEGWTEFNRDLSLNEFTSFPATCDEETATNRCRPNKDEVLTITGVTFPAATTAVITWVEAGLEAYRPVRYEVLRDSVVVATITIPPPPADVVRPTSATLSGLTPGETLNLGVRVRATRFLSSTDYPFTSGVFTTAFVCPTSLFVDRSASGSNDGTSWADAFTDLQDALTRARVCAAGTVETIHVAEGVYYPTTPADPNNVTQEERAVSFALVSGVALLGGYPSGGGTRDGQAHPTVLSGDIDGNDTGKDAAGVLASHTGIVGGNSRRVVEVSGTAVLDGLTITGGDGTGDGGGITVTDGAPTLRDLVVQGNRANIGGGVHVATGSSPLLEHLRVTGNRASQRGGGMAVFGSVTVDRLVVQANSAVNWGGGLLVGDGASTLSNVLLSGNVADIGGAARLEGGTIEFVNMTVAGNWSGAGGAVWFAGSTAVLTNLVMWGNGANFSPNSPITLESGAPRPTFRHSIVQHCVFGTSALCGVDDGTNLVEDPRFVDPIVPSSTPTTAGNWRLRVDSPGIDAGTNAPFEPGGSVEGVTTDLTGAERIQGGTVDLGPYEGGVAVGCRAVATTGFWSDASTWAGCPDGVPGPDDHATIPAGRTVVVGPAPRPDRLVGSEAHGGEVLGGEALGRVPTSPAEVGRLTVEGTLSVLELLVVHERLTNAGAVTVADGGTLRLASGPDAGSGIRIASYEALGGTLTGSLTYERYYDEPAGWRFLGTPFPGVRFVSLRPAFHTQGAPGAQYPTGDPILFRYEPSAAEPWVPVASYTQVLQPGQGYLFYLFDEGLNGADHLPGRWTVAGREPEGPVAAPVVYTGSETFNFVANPFAGPLDWHRAFEGASGLGAAYYVWDVSLGATGAYRSYVVTGAETGIGDAERFVAPFQGFFVTALEPSPSLVFTEAMKAVEASPVVVPRPADAGGSSADGSSESLSSVTLDVRGEGLVASRVTALFGEGAPSARWLSPLSSDALALRVEGAGGPLLVAGEAVPETLSSLDLSVGTSRSGSYVVSWPSVSVPETWSVRLVDHATGQTVDLRQAASYAFTLSASRPAGDPAGDPSGDPSDALLPGAPTAQGPERGATRFSLVVEPQGVSSEEGSGAVQAFGLEGVYPNPVRGSATVSVSLPSAQRARLSVYDVLGREVQVLLDGELPAGRHQAVLDASGLASGTYVVRLVSGSQQQVRRVTVVR